MRIFYYFLLLFFILRIYLFIPSTYHVRSCRVFRCKMVRWEGNREKVVQETTKHHCGLLQAALNNLSVRAIGLMRLRRL